MNCVNCEKNESMDKLEIKPSIDSFGNIYLGYTTDCYVHFYLCEICKSKMCYDCRNVKICFKCKSRCLICKTKNVVKKHAFIFNTDENINDDDKNDRLSKIKSRLQKKLKLKYNQTQNQTQNQYQKPNNFLCENEKCANVYATNMFSKLMMRMFKQKVVSQTQLRDIDQYSIITKIILSFVDNFFSKYF